MPEVDEVCQRTCRRIFARTSPTTVHGPNARIRGITSSMSSTDVAAELLNSPPSIGSFSPCAEPVRAKTSINVISNFFIVSA